jgi:hypothetical protein
MTRFELRFTGDDGLYEALKEWATKENRSIHGQIIYLLRRAVKEWR